ncbi:MAG: group II intron reverse transcriptase/maturase [Bacillota bacterium]|nr:group II intron reverse transcriptase/maturase [Bacillota bacterium]
MESETRGIRWQSRNRRKVENLMHLVDREALMQAHAKQPSGKASGIDGVTKEEYGRELGRNLCDLWERMKTFRYRPQSVRRAYIPKTDGRLRPLGIPAYEDKLVQSVMADLLTEVYEPRFRNCSYGYRPGRSAHQVVRYVNERIQRSQVNYVVEADIKGFFDNVDHEKLMMCLSHDIADKNFLRYIVRFLKAGVMEEGKMLESERGTPQGGLISPILANVYLHYLLDMWFEDRVRPRLKGEAYYVRYADDYLMMFQYEDEARAVMEAMKTQLSKGGLEVAEEKTRLLPMGRRTGTRESFDFLGFTFYNTKSRSGRRRLGVRTSQKKLKAKRQDVKGRLKKKRHQPIAETMKWIASVLRGHGNYYGVNGNFKSLQKFWNYVYWTTYRMLRRRSQRSKLTWEKYNKIWQSYVPRPRITVNIWY